MGPRFCLNRILFSELWLCYCFVVAEWQKRNAENKALIITIEKIMPPESRTGVSNTQPVGHMSAVFFNKFENEIFGNLYFGRLWFRTYFLANEPKNVPVLLQNRVYKTLISCKSNGKPKLPRRLSQKYDFVVFTNLLKMRLMWFTWCDCTSCVIVKNS